MQCNILKNFPFSRDGVTPEQAAAGATADIPAHLVPGLEREGYVRRAEAKDAGSSPENKMLAAAPENKAPDRAGTIRAVIGGLDPTRDFTDAGLPKVDAINALMEGEPVTAAERDEVWAGMQADA